MCHGLERAYCHQRCRKISPCLFGRPRLTIASHCVLDMHLSLDRSMKTQICVSRQIIVATNSWLTNNSCIAFSLWSLRAIRNTNSICIRGTRSPVLRAVFFLKKKAFDVSSQSCLAISRFICSTIICNYLLRSNFKLHFFSKLLVFFKFHRMHSTFNHYLLCIMHMHLDTNTTQLIELTKMYRSFSWDGFESIK